MASHGLLKRLPYVLEASPFPVSRDYMGADSSWSGAIHTRLWITNARCDLVQFGYQIQIHGLVGIFIENRGQTIENKRITKDLSRFR